MAHAVEGGECDIVSGFDEFVFWETEGVPLDDFLGQGLWDAGCLERRKYGRGCRVLGLGVEDILEPLCAGGECAE